MKKIFTLAIMTLLCFCNVAFAEELDVVQEISLYQRPGLSSNAYLAINDNATKLLEKTEQSMIFTSGSTSIELELVNSVDTQDTTINATDIFGNTGSVVTGTDTDNNKVGVADFLDDARFEQYLKEVEETTTQDDYLVKKAELTNIANQVRALYNQARINYIYYTDDGTMTIDSGSQDNTAVAGPNMPGLSNQYILKDGYRTMTSSLEVLSQKQGKLLYWKDTAGKATLISDDFIWSNNVSINSSSVGDSLTKLNQDSGGNRVKVNQDYLNSLSSATLASGQIWESEELRNYINNYLINSSDPDEQLYGMLALETLNREASRNGQSSTEGPTVLGDPIDPIDYYHYEEGNLMDPDAKSAEFNVLAKCWGCGTVVDTTPFQNQKLSSYYNMNKVLDYKFIINETLNVPEYNFTHTFTMHHYYAQDVPFEHYLETGHTTREVDDVLSILTDYNINKYFKPYVQDHMQSLYPDDYNYNKETGKWTLVNDRSDDRSAGVEEILGKAVEFRNTWYARIGVITEGYNEKSFFVLGPNDFNFENLVFAEVPGGEVGILMAIEVDSENGHNIYCQHMYEPIANATDIIMAKDEESAQENKKQYRLSDTCYYLCADCATCDEDGCDGLVASGIDYNTNNAIGQYFSKYCPEHACRFVWEWEADKDNNGETIEGLKCIDRKLDGFEYCYDHKCRSCSDPIVGLSQYPEAVGVSDSRATGSEDRSSYSNYCAAHKCRFVDCPEPREGGQVTSVNQNNPSCVESPLYCGIHSTVCCYCGKNPVSAGAYNAAGGIMMCESCQNNEATDISINQKCEYKQCALCGKMANVYFGGRVCNSCNRNYLWPLASLLEMDLSKGIKMDQLSRGINGEGQIDKRDGLHGVLYDADGNVVSANAVLSMQRAQEMGLYKWSSSNGVDYYGYGAHCANSVALTMGVALKLGGGTLYKDKRPLDINLYKFTADDGSSYVVPQFANQGVNCIWWGKITGVVYDDMGRTASGLNGTMISSDMNAQEVVNIMNNSQFIGSGSKDGAVWYHTFKNTGIPITFEHDGVEYDGYIFSNFGKGVGVGSDTYANDYKAFYAVGNTIYFIRLYVGEDGTWKTGGVERYGRERFCGGYAV